MCYGAHFTAPGAGGFEYACAQFGIAPDHEAEAPVDERPSRADEPHDQGRHRQTLPLDTHD